MPFIQKSRVARCSAAWRRALPAAGTAGENLGENLWKTRKREVVRADRVVPRKHPQTAPLSRFRDLGGPDGGMLAQTQQAAAEAGISDRVRWIGARQDIPACLKLIDLYLFPSRYEGLGIVLLEAQASGCRCAVSDVIPGEVDVGLGLISFHDLRAPAAQWAEEILSALPSGERPNPAQVLKAFQDTGFDAQLSMQTLLAIYQCG